MTQPEMDTLITTTRTASKVNCNGQFLTYLIGLYVRSIKATIHNFKVSEYKYIMYTLASVWRVI